MENNTSEVTKQEPTPAAPKKRQRIDPAELSRIRSEAGRKGGTAPRKRKRNKLKKVQMQVNMIDHDVISRYSRIRKKTMVGTIHFLARFILQQHPEIKPPSGWVE